MAKADFWLLHRLRVRFNEVDLQGLAHNSMSLVYFGVALNEYYRALPYDRFAAGQRDGTGLHVVKAVVEYRAPLRFDEEFDVGARIARLGRTSLTFAYELLGDGDGRVIWTGEQVWVNTSTVTHRPTEWPKDFVELVQSREAALERT